MTPIITPEAFHHIAVGIQSITLALAVIVGGLWTWYTFRNLASVQRAKAELTKLRLETLEQAIVSITVKARQMEPYTGQRFVIAGEATVTNGGNRNTVLNFTKKGCCSITRIEFAEDGQPEDREHVNLSLDTSTYYLRAGATVVFPFICRVKLPGVYRVNVSSPLHQPEAEQAGAASPSGPRGEYIWEGIDFVAVSAGPKRNRTA
jgi:hypothetical protein